MARALNQILTELNSVYQPQKDLYNKQLTDIDPQIEAEQKGLEAQKQDSFNQITQGANRRGLLFSGVPLEEQARYTGSSFLPAVANLKAKYAQQRFNLQDALAKINQDQYSNAYGMYNDELARDEAARTRAAAGGGTPRFGGGVLGASTGFGTADLPPQGITSLRSQWQKEANSGDLDAQILLNYVGDNNKYEGPVNSQWELEALQRNGVEGNYYLRQGTPGPGVLTPAFGQKVTSGATNALGGAARWTKNRLSSNINNIF